MNTVSTPDQATSRANARRKTLVKDALDKALDIQTCDLDYWIREVATNFAPMRRGRSADATVPAWMVAEGPLKQSIVEEFSFRARTEEAAARSISHMILCAPSLQAMDFYVTQLADEARHAYVFRHHLVDLGVPAERLEQEVERISGAKVAAILGPLEEFMQPALAAKDFAAMVVFLAVIAEGALAPAAEMSSLRWADVDPPAAEIGYGANLDEIRHLAVGTSFIRDHVAGRRDEAKRLSKMIAEGRELFANLPILETLLRREQLFQEGLEQHREAFASFEFVPGRRLVDTTVEERLALQWSWSEEMRSARLTEMGLAG
jgi:hypothetical protein